MNTPESDSLEEQRALEKHRKVFAAVSEALLQEEPGHQLVTRELLFELLINDSAEWDADPLIVTKFFAAWSGEQFFVCSFDPVEGTFFGLRGFDDVTWCHFSLEELLRIRGTLGMQIERNIRFEPIRASEVIEGYQAENRFPPPSNK